MRTRRPIRTLSRGILLDGEENPGARATFLQRIRLLLLPEFVSREPAAVQRPEADVGEEFRLVCVQPQFEFDSQLPVETPAAGSGRVEFRVRIRLRPNFSESLSEVVPVYQPFDSLPYHFGQLAQHHATSCFEGIRLLNCYGKLLEHHGALLPIPYG